MNNLMRYKNELMLLGSVLFVVISYIYKHHSEVQSQEERIRVEQEARELVEANSLQKLWANKTISKRLDMINSVVPSNKIHMSKKGKKATIRFSNLTAKELNRALSKILNIAIQIDDIDIKREAKQQYSMEVRCKW
jgi:DNA-binding Xre family transcriptional regulator